MILVDAGPLVALCDMGEERHDECRRLLGGVRLPMQTTIPALTEAMYLTGRRGGWKGQHALWTTVERGDLRTSTLARPGLLRCAALMTEYADTPMDFADASLVEAGERLNIRTIWTFDRHFAAYRMRGGKGFSILG